MVFVKLLRMSQYKSAEFVRSESDTSDDEVKPKVTEKPKKKKEKKEKREKEDRKEKKEKKEKKAKKERKVEKEKRGEKVCLFCTWKFPFRVF